MTSVQDGEYYSDPHDERAHQPARRQSDLGPLGGLARRQSDLGPLGGLVRPVGNPVEPLDTLRPHTSATMSSRHSSKTSKVPPHTHTHTRARAHTRTSKERERERYIQREKHTPWVAVVARTSSAVLPLLGACGGRAMIVKQGVWVCWHVP